MRFSSYDFFIKYLLLIPAEVSLGGFPGVKNTQELEAFKSLKTRQCQEHWGILRFSQYLMYLSLPLKGQSLKPQSNFEINLCKITKNV